MRVMWGLAAAALLATAVMGQDTPIVANAEEVTVDLIIRDKHGKAVRDLTPADLHITDDGSPVKITSLRLVGPSQPGSVKADLRNPRLVFFLFDEISQDAGRLARDAAMEMLNATSDPDVTFAVLKADHRLRLYQGFTTDREKLRRAIELAGNGAKTQRTAGSDAARDQLRGMGSGAQGQDALDRGDFRGLSFADRAMAQVLFQTMQDSERIERDEQARPSLAALLALSQQAERLPGRKTVVYFSQGLTVSSRVKDTLQNIVGVANRANVSIYAVDASGVTLQAKNEAGRRLLAQAAQSSFTSYMGSRDPSVVVPHGGSMPSLNAVTPDQAKLFDTMDDAIHASSQSPLINLSEATGGFYVGDTNDLRKPARRMIEDLETYYVASYVPPIRQYDGRFRTISVKTSLPKVRIQARSGYFSLPPNAGPGVRPYEAPMLGALSAASLPSELPYRSEVLQFGKTEAGELHSVVVELPLREAEFRPDPNAKLFGFHISVLAMVKRKSGDVVEKFSQDIPYQAALELQDRAKMGYFTFQRPLTLESGDYILETAIADRNSGKLSAQRSEFHVAEEPKGPILSDIALVRRLDPLPRTGDGSESFRYKNSKVVPDLSGIVARDQQTIPMFFVIYPDAKNAEKPKLELEVLRNGEPAGRVPMEVPAAGLPDGRIPFVASIPTNALGPGKYELRATVSQGDASTEKSIRFQVEGTELARASIPAHPAVSNPAGAEAPAEPVAPDVPDIAFQRKPLTITPVINAGSTLDTSELNRLIEGVRKRAQDYSDGLPNFTCIEVTHRSLDTTGLKKWRHQDTISELLSYRDKMEQRSTLEVNGNRVSTERDKLKGTMSNGEFGALLMAIFDPKVKAELHWKETDALGTATVQVFTFRVPRATSRYMLVAGANAAPARVGCHGLVYIDAETYGVRRIIMDADNVPRDYPMRAATISIDYDYVNISGHDFLLPVAGEVEARQGKRHLIRNQIEFREYKRFGAEASVKFE